MTQRFYSHVNYSVTKIEWNKMQASFVFYSHVNYSVTKIVIRQGRNRDKFYSHVNYSVTKIYSVISDLFLCFTVT